MLVRGCPCYKEFGKEKVCLNNDDVLPINAISVDPSFFEHITSVEELIKYKSNNERMCYLLIFLDKENGNVYCTSQGQKININDQDVKAIDIDQALQFVATTVQSSDGVVCSECLYKYLMLLGEVFEGIMTDEERISIIRDYIERIKQRIAEDIGGDEKQSYREMVNKRLDLLAQQKMKLASLAHDMKSKGADERLISLINQHHLLCRLEAVFLYQVVTLEEDVDSFVALGLVKFMIEVAQRVIELNDKIRSIKFDLDEAGISQTPIRDILAHFSKSRKSTEERFINLMKMLNEVDVQTSQ